MRSFEQVPMDLFFSLFRFSNMKGDKKDEIIFK